LGEDVMVLKGLFRSATPPKTDMRPQINSVVIYKFGNAPGSSFKSSFSCNGEMHYTSQQWSNGIAGESLDYHELPATPAYSYSWFV
jgi:hypothetical protein